MDSGGEADLRLEPLLRRLIMTFKVVAPEVPIIERTIYICEPCYNLEGEMCDTSECVFCRCTMKEVGDILNTLLIRPVIDGKRLKL